MARPIAYSVYALNISVPLGGPLPRCARVASSRALREAWPFRVAATMERPPSAAEASPRNPGGVVPPTRAGDAFRPSGGGGAPTGNRSRAPAGYRAYGASTNTSTRIGTARRVPTTITTVPPPPPRRAGAGTGATGRTGGGTEAERGAGATPGRSAAGSGRPAASAGPNRGDSTAGGGSWAPRSSDRGAAGSGALPRVVSNQGASAVVEGGPPGCW